MVDFLRGKFEVSPVLSIPDFSGKMFYNKFLVEGESRVMKPKAILVFTRELINYCSSYALAVCLSIFF